MEALGRASATDALDDIRRPLVVVLENVRSMQNVGSVFRSCDAFAVQALYLCGYTPTPPHRDIQKTALGATESVTWHHDTDATVTIQRLKTEGYKICSVEQAHGSTELQELSWDGSNPLALVFGNEVSGVSDEVLALSDLCVEIPQGGSKHSLNVSVAAGVVLWECTRNI